MRSKNVLFLMIVFGIIAVLYSSRFGGTYNGVITNTANLIPPFLAVLYGLNTARSYGTKNKHGMAILLMSAGLLFWFLGEFGFYLFQFVYEIKPYPSIADISTFAGYPLVMAGLIMEIKINKPSLRELNQYIKFLITLIMLMLGLAVLYFGIILAYKPGEPILNNLIAMSYGLGDLILIAPTLYILKMAVDYRGGKLFMPWGIILIALLLNLYADVFFAINRNLYTALEWPYNMIDLVWASSYMLFAYGFYAIYTYLHEIRSKINKN